MRLSSSPFAVNLISLSIHTGPDTNDPLIVRICAGIQVLRQRCEILLCLRRSPDDQLPDPELLSLGTIPDSVSAEYSVC